MQSRNGTRIPLSTPESFVRATAGAPQIVSASEVFITKSDGSHPAANSIPYISGSDGRLQYSAANLTNDGSLYLPGTLSVQGRSQLSGETTVSGAAIFTGEVNLQGSTYFTGPVDFPRGVAMTIQPNNGPTLTNVIAYNPSTNELLYQTASSGGGSSGGGGGGITSMTTTTPGNLTAATNTNTGAVLVNMKPTLTGLTAVTTADLTVTDNLSVNGDVIFSGLTPGGTYTHVLGIDVSGNVSKQIPSSGGGSTIDAGRNISVSYTGVTSTVDLNVTTDIDMSGNGLTKVGGISSVNNLLIRPGGNVGIMASGIPTEKLDVDGKVKAKGLLLTNVPTGTNTSFLSIDNSGNVSQQAISSGGSSSTTISPGNNISVTTNPTNSSDKIVALNVTTGIDMSGNVLTKVGGISSVGDLLISSGGKVGIMASGIPAEKLDIDGKVKATGLVLSDLSANTTYTHVLGVDANGNVSKQTISSSGTDITAESLVLKSSAALGAITGVTSVADPKVAFVAAAEANIGTSTLKYSYDGVSWYDASGGFVVDGFGGGDPTGSAIAYNGSRWVAVGTDTNDPTNTIKYSDDGKNWSNAASGGFITSGKSISWANGRWIALGSNPNPMIQYSDDGKNWLPGTIPNTFLTANKAIWDGTRWIVIGDSTDILTSTDGVTWSTILNVTGFFTNSAAEKINSIAYNGENYVAVGGSNIKYSADCITWTNSANPFSVSGSDIAWNGRVFVAVGSGTSRIKYSSTGTTWTDVTQSINIVGYSITWNPLANNGSGLWIVSGKPTNSANQVRIKYSTDISGSVWVDASGQALSSITQTSIFGVATSNTIDYGRIGVGTTAPTKPLDVCGDARIRGSLYLGGDPHNNVVRFSGTAYDSQDALDSLVPFTHTVIGERRYGGKERSELILFKGSDSDATLGPDRVRVVASGGFAVDAGNKSGQQMRWVDKGDLPTAAYPNALVVSAVGDVGIGTDNPLAKLDVNGRSIIRADGTLDSTVQPNVDTLTLQGVSGQTTTSILFTTPSATRANARIAGTNNDSTGGVWGGALIFQTSDVISLNERMRIDRVGNVGIGTSTPEATLHVNGTFCVTTGQQIILVKNGTQVFYAQSVVNMPNVPNAVNRIRIGGYAGVGGVPLTLNEAGGNVGIGTSAPTTTLDVAGSGRITGDLTVVGNVGIGTSAPTTTLDVAGSGRITGDLTVVGNVGIGTSTPAATLHVAGTFCVTTGQQINLLQNGTQVFYAQSVVNVPNAVNRIRIGGYAGVGGVPLTLNESGGNVGIGTSAPTTTLDVAGSGRITGDLTVVDGVVRIPGQNGLPDGGNGLFGDGVRGTLMVGTTRNTAGNIYTAGQLYNSSINSQGVIDATIDISIYGIGTIWGGQFVATSDRRIKKNICDISDGDALTKLRLIEPAEYDYIDARKGNKRIYGFIAQQVRDHFPEAVPITTETPPNFYQLCDVTYADNLMTLSGIINTELLATVDASSNVQVIDFKGKSLYPRVVAVDVSNSTLTMDISGQDITKDVSGNKIFLYGKEVNDFHTLNKDYLFTINFAATQELDREVQQLRAENVALKQKLDAIIQHLGITI